MLREVVLGVVQKMDQERRNPASERIKTVLTAMRSFNLSRSQAHITRVMNLSFLFSLYLIFSYLSSVAIFVQAKVGKAQIHNEHKHTHKHELEHKNKQYSRRQLQSPAKITLVLKFDGNPEDVSWTLTLQNNTALIDYVSPGAYTGLTSGATVERVISVLLGQTYTFTIVDVYGDGLADPGYYAMFFGDNQSPLQRSNVIFIKDELRGGKMDTIVFKAEKPTTPSPIATPTTSPAPTSLPTSCTGVDGIAGDIADVFNPKPNMKAPSVELPKNALCTRHRSYAACTNEQAEDCQWIFFSSSIRKGICRVDPVSKCLQTGDCVCHTEDFHGGRADYGNGVVFHAPISISLRDITEYAHLMTYIETYTQPSAAAQNLLHPLNDDFFISKVDFTARQIQYTFNDTSPVLFQAETHTVTFKVHYLYMDTPISGRIWSGLGMVVNINTAGSTHTLTVNGVTYTLPVLKKWTCTQIAITPTTIYAAGIGIDRIPSKETRPAASTRLTLGKFTGELFDVRIYSGYLSYLDIREIGARCTGPHDPAVLKASRDIDYLYDREGCKPGHESYFPEPTNGGQTYGSGPFATFWVRPKIDPLDPTIWLDIPEGEFDEERYFQHKKVQSYLWEKYLFENDMIAFNLKPYRSFTSADEIPPFARSIWNNPCRFMHQSNNQWSYPFYGNGMPTWTAALYGKSPDDVFDLATVINNTTVPLPSMALVAHEVYHEFMGAMYHTYAAYGTKWFDESGASFAPAFTMPAFDGIYSSFPLAPAYPLGYDNTQAETNPHFHTQELSLGDRVRGGHIYNSWLMWWFLAEYADLPHLMGMMSPNERQTAGTWNGILHSIRLYVETENMDFGDLWGTFVAHYRTWDFGPIGVAMAAKEKSSVDTAKADTLNDPPIPDSVTLEGRKTTVYLNPASGTNGVYVAGPSAQRPGPFGWNCLTAQGVSASRVVAISIIWDDGMGFQANTNPPKLPSQQTDCDLDSRFYNNVVMVYNEATGKRRYWKLKGKKPSTLYVHTGIEGPVTVHILMVPTPPTDYVGGRHFESNSAVSPFPIYSYKYSMQISDSLPTNAKLATEALKREDGIMQHEVATLGWWQIRCTCMDDPSTFSNLCVSPIFARITETSLTTGSPVSSSSIDPTLAVPFTLVSTSVPFSPAPMTFTPSSPSIPGSLVFTSVPTSSALSTPTLSLIPTVSLSTSVAPSDTSQTATSTATPTLSVPSNFASPAPSMPIDLFLSYRPSQYHPPVFESNLPTYLSSALPSAFPSNRGSKQVAPVLSSGTLTPHSSSHPTNASFVTFAPTSISQGNIMLNANKCSRPGESCTVNGDCCNSGCSQARCISSATMKVSHMGEWTLQALFTSWSIVFTTVVILILL